MTDPDVRVTTSEEAYKEVLRELVQRLDAGLDDTEADKLRGDLDLFWKLLTPEQVSRVRAYSVELDQCASTSKTNAR